MRKLILLILCGGLFITKGNTAITLVDQTTGQSIANGTTYQVWGDVTQSIITWHGIDAVNNTGNTTKINLRRYTLNAQATVEDYFCWYVCLGSVNSANTQQLNHSNGACFNSNDGDTITLFSSYYKSMGLTGSATYRYVWFDANNLTDTAWADITFNITPLSINEINLSASIYPNPVKNDLNIKLSNIVFNGSERVEIFDIIGNLVFSEKLSSYQSNIDVAEFENGVYLLNIVSDRKAIITKRIIISR